MGIMDDYVTHDDDALDEYTGGRWVGWGRWQGCAVAGWAGGGGDVSRPTRQGGAGTTAADQLPHHVLAYTEATVDREGRPQARGPALARRGLGDRLARGGYNFEITVSHQVWVAEWWGWARQGCPPRSSAAPTPTHPTPTTPHARTHAHVHAHALARMLPPLMPPRHLSCMRAGGGGCPRGARVAPPPPPPPAAANGAAGRRRAAAAWKQGAGWGWWGGWGGREGGLVWVQEATAPSLPPRHSRTHPVPPRPSSPPPLPMQEHNARASLVPGFVKATSMLALPHFPPPT